MTTTYIKVKKGTPGEIFDSRLACVTLLSVKVEGKGSYNIVYSAPSGRQVQHKSTAGKLLFLDSFEKDSIVQIITTD